MSRVQDASRRAEGPRRRPGGAVVERERERPFRVVTVSSNKGGVGKTTIATNLAVFVRALREDLPILVMSLDDQTTVDRMFALDAEPPRETIATALRTGHLAAAIRLGQFGVHYVPSDPRVGELKRELEDTTRLDCVLRAAEWPGLIVVDTKSDLEVLTHNALAASDLAILPVADQSSLEEAQKVFELFGEWGLSPERARILLSLVDRRIKYRGEEQGDVLALLVAEIRQRGLPLFESFLSRSPKIEGLYTNPEGRAHSILHAGARSLVSLQMRHLAQDVLGHVLPGNEAAASVRPSGEPALPQPAPRARTVLLEALTPEAARALATRPLPIRRLPFTIGRADPLVRNNLAIPDTRPWQVSRAHAALVDCGGRVGVLDRGSYLGCLVNGQPLGGQRGDRGPVPFDGPEGTLVLGTKDSPYRFRVMIR